MNIYLEWLVVLPLALPLIGAGLCVAAWGRPGVHKAITAVTMLALAADVIALFLLVWDNGPVTMTMGDWVPPFGITFIADVFSAGLVAAATFMAAVCLAFAAFTVDEEAMIRGFFPLFLALMAGVCGSFLTGDIFNLYVWFEVILIASIGLLIIDCTREQIDGAIKYTILSLIATTVFLVATGLLYGIAGTLNMADLALSLEGRGGEPLVFGVALLYLMAFGMKAAVFPLFFWLPASYHTGHPVVSAIFAALLTKVGVYVLIRVYTLIFPDVVGMDTVFLWLAAATMLSGAIGALAQSDLRRLIAFLVVSGIGYMLLGLAIGPQAMAGSILYLLHSMVVTAALFMGAGLARRMVGASWLRGRGIYRHAPFFSVLVLAVALSMAGSPPFGGLWPKVMLVDAGLAADAPVAVTAVLLAGFLSLVALGRAFALAFWADSGDERSAAHQIIAGPPVAAVAPFAVLVVTTALMGLWPAPFVTYAKRAADSAFDTAPYIAAVASDGPTMRGEPPPPVPNGDGPKGYGNAKKKAQAPDMSETLIARNP
ncbi:MAG: proton-conducting transporter membrane subunit [Alphaproteobacteria bacterium]